MSQHQQSNNDTSLTTNNSLSQFSLLSSPSNAAMSFFPMQSPIFSSFATFPATPTAQQFMNSPSQLLFGSSQSTNISNNNVHQLINNQNQNNNNNNNPLINGSNMTAMDAANLSMLYLPTPMVTNGDTNLFEQQLQMMTMENFNIEDIPNDLNNNHNILNNLGANNNNNNNNHNNNNGITDNLMKRDNKSIINNMLSNDNENRKEEGLVRKSKRGRKRKVLLINFFCHLISIQINFKNFLFFSCLQHHQTQINFIIFQVYLFVQ